MALLSVKQIGDLLQVSRQRANDFCIRGDLVKTGKKIDTDLAVNAVFLHARGVTTTHLAAVVAGTPPPSLLPTEQPKPPNTKKKTVEPPPGGPPDCIPPEWSGNVDAESVLERINSLDIRRLTNADVQKVQRLEGALKTRVEREHKRGLLIERALVQTVFGRLYTIDTNELRTLGAKLAPDICGTLGVEDPEKVLQIEQRIENEVLKTLAHIKRIINKFLLDTGGDAMEEGAA